MGGDPLPLPPDAAAVPVGAPPAAGAHDLAMADARGHSLRPGSLAGHRPDNPVAPGLGLHLGARQESDTKAS